MSRRAAQTKWYMQSPNQQENEMTAHIHAALMLQYAQDASTTDKPWEMWEFRCDEHEKWTILTGNPAWDDDTKYRRKPRTIRIGEIDIHEPVREPLQNFENYFVPAIDCGDYYANLFTWYNDSTDKRLLKQGMVYLTNEAALAHAKALVALTAKE